jgi:hypothetical protein
MGSGFKNFTSTVLTASDVNNFLMEQTVMSFASTGARDAQITSPEAGMVAYVRSNNVDEGLYTYSSALGWRKGPGWNAPWGLVQYAERTANIGGVNAAILSTTVSVLNRRRYHLVAQVPGFFSSTTANSTASVLLLVGGNTIAEARVWTGRVFNADMGCTVSGVFTAFATNATLSMQVYSAVIAGANHEYLGAVGKPISLTVTDVGPSGAPV